jgi:predicted nucleic acid-binding protein
VIIVDTEVWVGLADRRDQYHVRCREFLRHNREPLITTYPVLVEAVHLLFRRVGVSMTLTWLKTLQNHEFRLFPLRVEHLSRITDLMHQYADLPMDLADASLVLLAEQQGDGRIVSTDERDFHTYRWKNHHPFRNLLWEGTRSSGNES